MSDMGVDASSSEAEYLSDRQEIVLSLLTVIACSLSLIGSSTIVYKVLRDHRKATTYDRLLLGLSVSDILASLGYGLNPFLVPKATSVRVWAMGTSATCNWLGFMTQVAFAPSLYNSFLSFYFLLTIRFAVSKRFFAEKMELWMHIAVWFFILGTASTGSIVGFYAEVDVTMGCWVKDYPRGCEGSACLSPLIGWVFGALPIFFALLSLIVNNIIIYKYVRWNLGVSLRWRKQQTLEETYTRRQLYIREVAIQGFLYVGSWFIAFTAPTVIRIAEAQNYIVAETEARFFWLLVLDAFFRPLQGFCNMFVYNRPNYTRFRAVYPERSPWWAVRRACLDPNTPLLSQAPVPSSNRFTNSGSSKSGNKKMGKNSNLARFSSKSGPKSDSKGCRSSLDVVMEEESADFSSSRHPREPPEEMTKEEGSSQTGADVAEGTQHPTAEPPSRTGPHIIQIDEDYSCDDDDEFSVDSFDIEETQRIFLESVKALRTANKI